jgi:hypothetical protein
MGSAEAPNEIASTKKSCHEDQQAKDARRKTVIIRRTDEAYARQVEANDSAPKKQRPAKPHLGVPFAYSIQPARMRVRLRERPVPFDLHTVQ